VVSHDLAFSIPSNENGEVITVTEPQVWTMIGVFTALMFGMLTVVSTLFVRVVRSEIGGVRAELVGTRGELEGQIGGLRGEMNASIGGLRSELNAQIGGLREEMNAQIGGLREEMNAQIGGLRGEMNARFDAVHVKIDGLDRDVQLLMNREFGTERN
jgi:hypothetical protein